jgi:uncharacterized DUF497 family protein
MRFVRDEAKRLANLEKHGTDFADAEQIFHGLTSPQKTRVKLMANGVFSPSACWKSRVSIAHTESSEEIRVISIRKATKHETRFYFSQIPY